MNPHGWIWIDVKGEDGTVTKWGIEGGSPNGLIRNGITKDSLKIGEELVVRGYGTRDGSNLVAGVSYQRADGKEFWLANDGAEARRRPRATCEMRAASVRDALARPGLCCLVARRRCRGRAGSAGSDLQGASDRSRPARI